MLYEVITLLYFLIVTLLVSAFTTKIPTNEAFAGTNTYYTLTYNDNGADSGDVPVDDNEYSLNGTDIAQVYGNSDGNGAQNSVKLVKDGRNNFV